MIWVWSKGASILTDSADETSNLNVTTDETSNVKQALVGVLGWKLNSQASQPSCTAFPHDELTVAVVSYNPT